MVIFFCFAALAVGWSAYVRHDIKTRLWYCAHTKGVPILSMHGCTGATEIRRERLGLWFEALVGMAFVILFSLHVSGVATIVAYNTSTGWVAAMLAITVLCVSCTVIVMVRHEKRFRYLIKQACSEKRW